MHKVTRFMMAAAVLVFIVGGALFAAGSGEKATSPSGLPRETLRFYFFGEEKPDMPMVLEEIESRTSDELNVDLEFIFVPPADYAQKLNVLTASGDAFDAAFNADWLNFSMLAQRGALLDIKDLWPQYAPNLYEKYGAQELRAVTMTDGGVYAVPWRWKKTNRSVFYARNDIAEAVGISEDTVQTIADIEEALLRIKAAYPEIMPYAFKPGKTRLLSLFMETKGYVTTELSPPNMVVYRWDDPDSTVYGVEQVPEFEEYVELINRWHKLGLMPRNPLAIKDDPQAVLMPAGRVAAFTHVSPAWPNLDATIREANPEWGGVTLIPLHPEAKTSYAPPTNNLMVLNRNAANPERALMFFEWATGSQENFDLLIYGIEGVHYQLDGEKVQRLPAGGNFLDWRGQWGFWHPELRRSWANEDDAYLAKEREVLDMNVDFPALTGFTFDPTPVRTALAHRLSLWDRTGYALLVGMLPPEDVAAFAEDQKDAGYDAFISELQRQIDAWKQE